jgi:hypothetical protein
MKTMKATPADEELRKDILRLCRKHIGNNNTPERVLAVASQVVGQVLALQDQVTLGKDKALQIIQANIEKGNQDFIKSIMKENPAAPFGKMN